MYRFNLLCVIVDEYLYYNYANDLLLLVLDKYLTLHFKIIYVIVKIYMQRLCSLKWER